MKKSITRIVCLVLLISILFSASAFASTPTGRFTDVPAEKAHSVRGVDGKRVHCYYMQH